MKGIGTLVRWITGQRGVATSLVEATATVAIGAVLAGVAVGSAIDAIDNSKVQAAVADVTAIGQGIITFYKDNSFFPLFVDGRRTGPTDDYYGILVSENGNYPADSSLSAPGGTGTGWDIPVSATGASASAWSTPGYFGDMPDYSAKKHATIEGHLVRNILSNPVATAPGTPGTFYPLRGSFIGDPQRGWAGPYITSLPKTDPWGDKYLVNVRNLHSAYLKVVNGTSGGQANLAVMVLSAGPNRNIETHVDQPYDSFTASGDDIVFRIK